MCIEQATYRPVGRPSTLPWKSSSSYLPTLPPALLHPPGTRPSRPAAASASPTPAPSECAPASPKSKSWYASRDQVTRHLGGTRAFRLAIVDPHRQEQLLPLPPPLLPVCGQSRVPRRLEHGAADELHALAVVLGRASDSLSRELADISPGDVATSHALAGQ